MKLYYRSLVLIILCTLISWDLNAQLNSSLSPDTVVVNEETVYQIQLTATDTIPVNTIVHLQTPSGLKPIVWPLFPNVFVSSSGASGMQILTSLSPSALKPPIWDHDLLPVIISARIKNTDLLPGEHINVTIGSPILNGSLLVQTIKTDGIIEFKVALEDLTGTWTEVTRMRLYNIADVPAGIRLHAQSVVKTGESDVLKLVVEDKWHNRSRNFEGSVSITGDASAILPSPIVFTSADSGYREIPVTYTAEGFYNFQATVTSVTSPDADLAVNDGAVSNYTWVQDDPEYYIYWGDLHSHSGWSKDGFGPNTFNYARFTSCLDYYSPAEHVNGQSDNEFFGLNEEEWSDIKNGIVSFHKPGEFVPITAYETSYFANEGGHHIAYFEHDDSDIDDVPLIPRLTYHSIFEFWDRLDQLPSHIKALSWAHFTGQFFYTDHSEPSWGVNDLSINDGEISRLVGEEYISPYRTLFEVFSQHGQSEYYDENHPLNKQTGHWFVQDALAMGEKVGISSFTDGHEGKPGYPGSGLGAAMVPDLNRTALFDAFRSRRTYGTTGERIIMDFRINDSIMGREVNIESDLVPEITFFVQGTDEIDRVEIVKWDFIDGTYGDDYHPDFEVIGSFVAGENETFYENSLLDMDFYGHAVYYMRVIQKNEVEETPVWGWSSPIWVNNLNLDTMILGESLTTTASIVEIYPNPAGKNSTINIQLNSEENVMMTMSVFNASGQRFKHFDYPVVVGSNEVPFQLPELASGQYWIRLTDTRGRYFGSKAFTIQ